MQTRRFSTGDVDRFNSSLPDLPTLRHSGNHNQSLKSPESIGRDVHHFLSDRTGTTNIEGDGDPMDICVLTEKTFAHGSFFLLAKPIGGLRMIDGSQADDKIIAILDSDLAYGHITEISECPAALIDRLKHYFLSYKQLPGDAPRRVEIADVYGRAEALDVITRSMRDYDKEFRV